MHALGHHRFRQVLGFHFLLDLPRQYLFHCRCRGRLESPFLCEEVIKVGANWHFILLEIYSFFRQPQIIFGRGLRFFDEAMQQDHLSILESE